MAANGGGTTAVTKQQWVKWPNASSVKSSLTRPATVALGEPFRHCSASLRDEVRLAWLLNVAGVAAELP